MKRWEYATIGDSFETLLAMGADGWEAYAVLEDARGQVTYYMKRPLPEEKPVEG